MLQRIRTYIRSERQVLLALGAATCVALVVTISAFLLGDERDVQVLSSWPPSDVQVPGTLRAITIEFPANVDHDAVDDRLSISPAVPASLRWRGSTLDVLPDSPLVPGTYFVRIEAGTVGRGGEALRSPFELQLSVRDAAVIGIAVRDTSQSVVRYEADGTLTELISAERVIHFAPSPDGRYVAAAVSEGGADGLELFDTVTGTSEDLGAPEGAFLAWVDWAPDGQSLLVSRGDPILGGGVGSARTWLVRIDGEFVAEVDSEGEPAIAPGWSPNGDRIAYVAPASGRLVALHVTTQERVDLGVPRSRAFVWSPAGDRIAFESAPETEGDAPLQQVRVRSLDLRTDIRIGTEGEIVSRPSWFDIDTLAVVWRQTGESTLGTQLWIVSLPTGEKLRAVQIGEPGVSIAGWSADPGRDRIVVRADGPDGGVLTIVDLVTNERTVLPASLRDPTWLP
jgi:Tol biopolymer transport system component